MYSEWVNGIKIIVYFIPGTETYFIYSSTWFRGMNRVLVFFHPKGQYFSCKLKIAPFYSLIFFSYNFLLKTS